MTPKSNWANRTKETLATTEAPAIPSGMRVIGGSEDIIAYYRFTAPKVPNAKSRVLAKGDTFTGTYDGKFESKTYAGQYTHKVRTAEGLIGLPGCTQLNNYLGKVSEGTEVQVVYRGKNTIETGRFAGKEAHSFQVAANVDGNVEPAK